MCVGEIDSFGSKLIENWRPDFGVGVVAGKVTYSEVIRKNDHNVRCAGNARLRGGKAKRKYQYRRAYPNACIQQFLLSPKRFEL